MEARCSACSRPTYLMPKSSTQSVNDMGRKSESHLDDSPWHQFPSLHYQIFSCRISRHTNNMCSRPTSRQYLAISDMSSSPNLINSLGSCPFESRSSPLGISFRSSARTDRCCQRHNVTLSTNNRQDNSEPSTMITPGQPIFTQPPNRLSDARRASAFLFEFAIM